MGVLEIHGQHPAGEHGVIDLNRLLTHLAQVDGTIGRPGSGDGLCLPRQFLKGCAIVRIADAQPARQLLGIQLERNIRNEYRVHNPSW